MTLEHAFALIIHHAKRKPHSLTQSKAASIIYHDYIFVLITWHNNILHHITLPTACPSLLYFL
jgi:hypothetical protein